LKKRGIKPGIKMPRVRTDNGPQFIAKLFEELCRKLGIIHERIPVGTPNLNAHIEAFHSILEDDCYSRYQFNSYAETYEQISLYMEYYNQRRRHGSLKNMAPEKYHQAIISNSIKPQVLVA
jgi:putative transposase